jgi:hypothetical protein
MQGANRLERAYLCGLVGETKLTADIVPRSILDDDRQ